MTALQHSTFSVPRRRYAPLATVGITEHVQPEVKAKATFAAECPDCGKHFVQAAVVHGTPEYSAKHGTPVKSLSYHCDGCNHVVIVLCSCNADGSRIGERLAAPGFIVGQRAVEAFLKKHPEAAGVEM